MFSLTYPQTSHEMKGGQ